MKPSHWMVGLVAMVTVGMPLASADLPQDRRIDPNEVRDFERFQADRIAELRSVWDGPSPLSPGSALDLMMGLSQGLAIPEADGLALAQYLRDAREGDAARELARDWFAGLVDLELQRLLAGEGSGGSGGPWQQDNWDDYGVVLTGAYLLGGTVVPDLLPHNLRLLDILIELDVDAGCQGGFSSGFCFLRVTLDLAALLALDLHQTTDTALAQFPISIELHVHWQCSFGCSLSFHIHFPETLIAANAEFVFAYPAMAGEVATRVTDHEILQMVYDRLARLDFRRAREWTSAPPLAGTPANSAVPGGTPGVGDLHAAAPIPNYYGLQVPPEAPNRPALPGTPALPGPAQGAVNQLRDMYAKTHVRVRDDFGTLAADPTGPTVGYQMSEIRAWHLNIAIVRWKNVGAAETGALPEPPASFYYDAGFYFNGGGGNQRTVDFSIRDMIL